MKILAIETSCDETAVAVVEKLASGLSRALSETVASSQDMHVNTGGIVPEVAAREQMVSMLPVLKECLTPLVNSDSIEKIGAWAKEHVDAIAVTQGPGLIGSLLVGVETAKTLAMSWGKPLIPVNHVLAHVYGAWIEGEDRQTPPEFPVLALVVSGLHSDLILMHSHTEFEVVGMSRDDAAGECFDKCARLLGLPYPGGPEISRLAKAYREEFGNEPAVELPKPLNDKNTLDMSFSGLKVAVQRVLKELPDNDKSKMEVAAALESTIVESLVDKTRLAIEKYSPRSVVLAGGVAANALLRQTLEDACEGENVSFYMPIVKYCTDNAVMVGAKAIFSNKEIEPLELAALPSLEIT